MNMGTIRATSDGSVAAGRQHPPTPTATPMGRRGRRTPRPPHPTATPAGVTTPPPRHVHVRRTHRQAWRPAARTRGSRRPRPSTPARAPASDDSNRLARYSRETPKAGPISNLPDPRATASAVASGPPPTTPTDPPGSSIILNNPHRGNDRRNTLTSSPRYARNCEPTPGFIRHPHRTRPARDSRAGNFPFPPDEVTQSTGDAIPCVTSTLHPPWSRAVRQQPRPG